MQNLALPQHQMSAVSLASTSSLNSLPSPALPSNDDLRSSTANTGQQTATGLNAFADMLKERKRGQARTHKLLGDAWLMAGCWPNALAWYASFAFALKKAIQRLLMLQSRLMIICGLRRPRMEC
jgi:hypothetical protein